MRVTVRNIQSWLNDTKFDVGAVESDWEEIAVGAVFGKLDRVYDTSVWIDGDTTPAVIKQLLSMWMASVYLRRAASEEDGLTTYADWLERRVDTLCDGLLDGSIEIPGVDIDPTSADGGSAAFYPNDASKALAEACINWDGTSDQGSRALMSMNMTF